MSKTDYVLKNVSQAPDNKDAFLTGLVFGLDVGTGSTGYAGRRGSNFLPGGVGVLICDSEGSDLSKSGAICAASAARSEAKNSGGNGLPEN